MRFAHDLKNLNLGILAGWWHVESESGAPLGAIDKRRILCTEECYCVSGERTVQARLRDLSGEGAYLCTTDPFPVGDRIRLRVNLEGKLVEPFGIVRHSESGYGMGIQFLDIQPEHRQVLEEFLSAVQLRLGSAAYSRVRTAERINHAAKIMVWGKNMEGVSFSEETETVDVSDVGARLLLRERVPRGELLTVRVLSQGGGSRAQFRTVWQGAPGTPVENHVGVDLLLVDLWGVHHLSGQ